MITNDNNIFFKASCLFSIDGLLQIALIFDNKLDIPLEQQVVPTSNEVIALILFVGWIVAFAMFGIGLARRVFAA